MHDIHSGNKAIQHYRECRRRDKAKAILRAEIVKNNPDLAGKPKQLEAVIEGAMKARGLAPRKSNIQQKGFVRRR